MPLRLLALSFLLVIAGVAGASTLPAPVVYTAHATGELVIGPDEKVAEASLKAPGMDARMRDEYLAHLRRWTFEPVVEDGAPVAVRVPVQLALRAAVDPATDQASLYIEKAWFLTPPAVREMQAPADRPIMSPPRYPEQAFRAGVGAEVMLLVELGEDGRVARAAAREVALLAASPGRAVNAYVRSMVKAAEQAAAGWRIPGYRAGDRVLVPVSFNPGNGFWSRRQPYDFQPVAWVVESQVTHSLASGGSPTDGRIKLVTPLGPAAETASPPAGS